MNESFVYTESVRRRAQKLKALAEGEEEQKRLAGVAPTKKGSPAALQPSRRNATSSTASSVRAVKRTPPAPGPSARSGPKAAGKAPAATSRTVAPLPGPAARQKASRTGGLIMPGATPAKVRPIPNTNTKPARTNTGRVPAVPAKSTLKASEERLLLESKELDLFETGQSMKVSVCPECQHELVKVVCLGTTVRVCLDCKGTWFPYPVVREFAREHEWFQQLAPAIQLELDKHRTSR